MNKNQEISVEEAEKMAAEKLRREALLKEEWLQTALHKLQNSFDWEYNDRRMWSNGQRRKDLLALSAALGKAKSIVDKMKTEDRNEVWLLSAVITAANGDVPKSLAVLGLNNQPNFNEEEQSGDAYQYFISDPNNTKHYGFRTLDGTTLDTSPLEATIDELLNTVRWMSPPDAERREADKDLPKHVKAVGEIPEWVSSLKAGAPPRMLCILKFYETVGRHWMAKTSRKLRAKGGEKNHACIVYMKDILSVVLESLNKGDENEKLLASELGKSALEAVVAAKEIIDKPAKK